ncbi:MAG: N-acetylmuramoyl-L-alanine amidase [Deltaproteobacteria bacterium]|nr:N-acetylmuramoyl-L-alanine amidase [Deltaproteobacteria bacterium]
MRKQSREAILLIIFLFIIPGCVSMPPLPSSQFQLDQIDTAALKGKVIVIDPGHGGMYRGAIGKMGLRESEVNMGVALYLWGLLHDAGAYPIMTRTADTNVAFSPSKQLSDDLLARSRLSNYLKPDLFISIHHNSNTNDTKKNNLEVYYKLMDPGPSQELAECIMERIENTFEVEKAQVLPGNYSVLRETRATAILGEASYLTHKENERRLSLHGFLRLEAEAYFLGILDYFRGGVPRILNLTPNGDFLCDAQPEVVGLVKDDEHGKGIDPDSVTLYLDGNVVATRYDPLTGRVRYIPESPLNNGSHTLRLEAKNLGGNSATPVSTVFYTSLYPFQIETRPLIATLLPDGLSRTRITAEIVDENLNPVADGTLVSFYTSAGRVVDSLVTSRKGKAITHLIADYQLGHAEVVAASGGVYNSCIVTLGKPEEKIIEVYVHDRQGNPLEGAEVIFEEETYLKTDHLGYCFNKGNDDGGLEFTVWKNGYLPLKGFLDLGGEEVVREKLVLTPVDHGLMWHKVIVIDPQGREDSSLTDDSRERSRAEINYTTALCLRKMLELAGATVFLTRGSDSVSTSIERVIKANKTRADLLISLDHRKGSSYLGYYFNSSKGKFLARSIKQVIDDELSCKKLKMMEGREFVLIHTGMPAVVVSLDCRRCKRLPRDEEERPWVEAQALYQGLRSYFKGMSQI